MPLTTLTVEKHFALDAEGFVATPANATVSMGWYPPHKKRNHTALVGAYFTDRMASPLLSTMGGCLKTTAKRNGGAARENYWEWTGTWEDLGVPAGETVRTVQGDYLWRYMLTGSSIGNPTSSDAAWGANELGSGPFEFRLGTGVLLDTFSARDYAPARSSGGVKVWPAGAPQQIAFKMTGWRDLVGTPAGVDPVSVGPSGTSIKLRLRSILPATIDANQQWIRLKQDYVKLTITYGTAVAQSNFFAFQ